jgi:hypothetical protein
MSLGDGRQALFWEDKWIDGECILDIAPLIHQKVHKAKRSYQTVKEALEMGKGDRRWAIPNSPTRILGCLAYHGGRPANRGPGQVSLEMDARWQLLSMLGIQNAPSWCNSFPRSPARLEDLGTAPSEVLPLAHSTTSTLDSRQAFRGHRLVWKTWAPLRVRFFLWLTLRRQHWTADRRARHGLEAKDACFLCDQAPETIDHIVVACPYTRELWHHILQALHLQLPAGTASSLIWWRRIRVLASGQWRKGLDTLFALVF